MWYVTQSSLYPTQLPNTTPCYHIIQLFYLGEASKELHKENKQVHSSGRGAKANMETEEYQSKASVYLICVIFTVTLWLP